MEGRHRLMPAPNSGASALVLLVIATSASASTIPAASTSNVAPTAALTVQAPYAPGFRAVPTDPSKVYSEPLTAVPYYLIPSLQSPFGTTVTRITGPVGSVFPTSLETGAWTTDARHHYAKDQPWSSDGSLIAIDNEAGSPRRVYLDGETYHVRYEQCYEHATGDDRWHPSPAHPHERISVSGSELMWIDVVACQKTRTWKLPFPVIGLGEYEGNPSFNGRFVALCNDTSAFVVDMDPQPPFAPYPAQRVGPAVRLANCGLNDCSLDWVSISPSGKYVVVKYNGEPLRVFDVDPATLALTPRPMPSTSPRCHGTAAQGYVYDLGHLDMTRDPLDNNEDVMVGQEHCGNIGRTVNGQLMGGVVKVRIKDGAVTSLTDPTNEAYPHHVSCRSVLRPGWAYATYFPQPGKRFSGEIVAVKIDGSKAVQRLAYDHTDFTGCYRCEAHGVPSPDGRRVLWASNWNQACSACGAESDIKAYVADARALGVPGAQPMAPYVVIADASRSTDADGRIASYAFDFGDGATAGPQVSPLAPHTYQTGRWTLRVTVIDNSGATATASQNIVVGATTNQPPIAALSVTPATGSAPLAVVADASASRAGAGSIASYKFNFGDGTVVTGVVPTAAHVYYAAGTRTASVIVTDVAGLADTATATVRTSTASGDTLSPNLVGNPSFESDLTGWRGYGGASISRVPGGELGSWSLGVTGPLTLSVFGVNDSPNWVASVAVAGTRFRIAAWVRAGAAAGNCKLQVREWLGGLQQGSTVYSPYVRLGRGWQQVAVDLFARSTGSTVDVQVIDAPALAGEKFYVDNVSIRVLKATAPLAAPGDPDSSALAYAPGISPNPMFRGGALDFATARGGPLRVEIYDAAGRVVRLLADEGFAPAGSRHIEIDGRDGRGLPLAAGIYLYRIQSSAGRASGRFVIMR